MCACVGVRGMCVRAFVRSCLRVCQCVYPCMDVCAGLNEYLFVLLCNGPIAYTDKHFDLIRFDYSSP